VQQVLAQQMQLPPELRTQLEVACSNWLPTQLHDLDAVVGTAMGSPEQQAADGQEEAEEGEEAVEEQEEEEGPAWRCFLLAQLSLGGLLDVLEKAQPRCPYQTTVLSAITVWAAARWPQQQQQQAQGEEVADACIPPEEALQLAGAVRLAGLPRSLLPCLQQLPWWRAAVSPGERGAGGWALQSCSCFARGVHCMMPHTDWLPNTDSYHRHTHEPSSTGTGVGCRYQSGSCALHLPDIHQAT
jgi:hypothetical protein